RTALIKDGMMYVQAGAGIVADSNPKFEQQECVDKAKALFRAAEEAKRFASAARRGRERRNPGRPGQDRGDDMEAETDRRRAPKWKHDGVRVIPGHALDPNTPQTPGMDRKAAVNYARVGAQKIWAGTVNIRPNAKTGAHHHGELESIIYVVRGKARMRWG